MTKQDSSTDSRPVEQQSKEELLTRSKLIDKVIRQIFEKLPANQATQAVVPYLDQKQQIFDGFTHSNLPDEEIFKRIEFLNTLLTELQKLQEDFVPAQINEYEMLKQRLIDLYISRGPRPATIRLDAIEMTLEVKSSGTG